MAKFFQKVVDWKWNAILISTLNWRFLFPVWLTSKSLSLFYWTLQLQINIDLDV